MNTRPARAAALQHGHEHAVPAGALEKFSHPDRRRLFAASAVVLAGAAFAVPLVLGASASAEAATTVAAPTTTTTEADTTLTLAGPSSTTTSAPQPATTTTIVAAPALGPTVRIGTAVSFQSNTQTLDVGVQVIPGAPPSTGSLANAAELPHTGGSPLPLTLVGIGMILMGALAMRCRPQIFSRPERS